MKKLKNTLNIILLLSVCPVTYAGFEIIDAPVLKNYALDNPGLETFIPFLQEVDSNADGLPESLSVAFNLYPAGSSTALFQTPMKSFTYPTSPCVNPQSTTTNSNLKFKFAPIKSTIMLRSTKITCQDKGVSGYSTKYFGLVYASDLSAAGQNTWTQQFDQQIVAADVIPDINSNNYSELVVVTSDNNGHVTVYLLDGYTGLPLKTTRTYVSGPVN